jgi:hypothetical protein
VRRLLAEVHAGADEQQVVRRHRFVLAEQPTLIGMRVGEPLTSRNAKPTQTQQLAGDNGSGWALARSLQNALPGQGFSMRNMKDRVSNIRFVLNSKYFPNSRRENGIRVNVPMASRNRRPENFISASTF